MCKEILGNQKGMSLIEVVVASAVSIIIAMGVMQINENAQKGIQSIQGRDDKLQFKRLLVREMANPSKCTAAIGGTNTNVTNNITFPDGTTNFNDLGAASFTDNELLPMALSYKVDEVRLRAFTGATVVGTCYLEIDLWEFKVHRDPLAKNLTTLKIPLVCQVNNTTAKLMQSCSATDTQEHGHFNLIDKPNTPGEYLLQAKGDGSGNNKDTYLFGQAFYADPPGADTSLDVLSAMITLSPTGNNIWSNGPADHALAIGTNNVITFGDSDEVGLFYNPAFDDQTAGSLPTVASPTTPGGNTLATNDGFLVSENLFASGNIYSKNKVAANTVNAVTGNINTLNVVTTNATTINVDNIFVDGINQHSDRRFKKDIETIQNASEDLSELRGVTYFMRRDEFPKYHFNNKLQHGLIAQEVERVFPNLVHTDQESGYKSVKYSNIVSILIEAFKEQKIEIEKNKKMFLVMKEGIRAQDTKQNSRLDALEQENKALRSELDKLKEQVRKILKNKED